MDCDAALKQEYVETHTLAQYLEDLRKHKREIHPGIAIPLLYKAYRDGNLSERTRIVVIACGRRISERVRPEDLKLSFFPFREQAQRMYEDRYPPRKTFRRKPRVYFHAVRLERTKRALSVVFRVKEPT